MKKITMMALALMMLAVSPVVHADGHTATVNGKAVVTEELILNAAVIKNFDPKGDNNVDVYPNMDYGTLVRDLDNNVQRSDGAFTHFIGVRSSRRDYIVKATFPALNNGSVDLPDAQVFQVIQATSNGDDIAGDSLSTVARSAIMNDVTIYTSSTSGATKGSAAVIEAVTGISGGLEEGLPFPTWEPVLLDNPGGTYTSTLTYTAVLV